MQPGRWVDDYRKVVEKNPRGLPGRWKYFWQSVFGLAAAWVLYSTAQSPAELELIVPFFKNVALPMGVFYVVFTYFVIVGTSNAVNLTDGLDGLAILPTVLVSGALGIIAYLTGNYQFATYLHIPYISGAIKAEAKFEFLINEIAYDYARKRQLQSMIKKHFVV